MHKETGDPATAQLEAEIKKNSAELRSLRASEDSPRFAEACRTLGIHAVELQSRYHIFFLRPETRQREDFAEGTSDPRIVATRYAHYLKRMKASFASVLAERQKLVGTVREHTCAHSEERR